MHDTTSSSSRLPPPLPLPTSSLGWNPRAHSQPNSPRLWLCSPQHPTGTTAWTAATKVPVGRTRWCPPTRLTRTLPPTWMYVSQCLALSCINRARLTAAPWFGVMFGLVCSVSLSLVVCACCWCCAPGFVCSDAQCQNEKVSRAQWKIPDSDIVRQWKIQWKIPDSVN